MPDESTYGFSKDDATDILAMVGNGDSGFSEMRPRGSNGAIIILTPSGGIPARSGMSLGSAVCDTYTITDTNEMTPTGMSVTVLNMTATPVEGDAYGQAKKISGKWVVDVEECEPEEPSSSSSVVP